MSRGCAWCGKTVERAGIFCSDACLQGRRQQLKDEQEERERQAREARGEAEPETMPPPTPEEQHAVATLERQRADQARNEIDAEIMGQPLDIQGGLLTDDSLQEPIQPELALDTPLRSRGTDLAIRCATCGSPHVSCDECSGRRSRSDSLAERVYMLMGG